MTTQLQKKTIETYEKPAGYEDVLSDYGPVLHDGCCGEPIAWGFNIRQHLGDRFGALGKYGTLECVKRFPSQWALVVHTLTREEAIAKYGPITDEEFGPRGGFQSVTFGTKRFFAKQLRGY